MKSWSMITALLGVLALATFASAQLAPGPDLAKLSNLAFGWVSMSGSDPTMDMLTSFAPNSMALRDAGYRSGGERVSGIFNFSDLEVDSNFTSALTAAGPGVLRICQYTYDAKPANIVGIPGLPARTSGEAIEVSYAQHVNKNIAVGLSVVPRDTGKTDLVASGINMVEAESKTDYGARAGVIVSLPRDVKFGFDYSYQRDSGTARLNPLLTSAPDWITIKSKYITKCSTLGLSKKISSKAMGYLSYQNITANGLSDGKRKADQVRFGGTYNFTRKFAARAYYVDGGGNYSVMWHSPIGIVNLAYTHGALMNAESIIGKGDAAFAALAVAF